MILLVSYLLLVFVLPVVLSVALSYRALPVGRACSACSGSTVRVLDGRLRFASRLHPLTELQRRWCLHCGWEGVVRIPRRRPAEPWLPAPEFAGPPAGTSSPGQGVRQGTPGGDGPGAPPAGEAGPGPAGGRQATQTLDVRALVIDGRSWRVMLQCWYHTGHCYGRLVFIAPSGRLLLDAVEPFQGVDEQEILGRARSLPDGLLTNRLRRLVRDY